MDIFWHIGMHKDMENKPVTQVIFHATVTLNFQWIYI